MLYAPGLRTAAEIRAVVEAIDRPLNVVTGWLEPGITVADVAAAGAKRISVGGALNRLALAAFVDGARAMKEEGSFAWMQRIADMGAVRKLFAPTGWWPATCFPRGMSLPLIDVHTHMYLPRYVALLRQRTRYRASYRERAAIGW